METAVFTATTEGADCGTVELDNESVLQSCRRTLENGPKEKRVAAMPVLGKLAVLREFPEVRRLLAEQLASSEYPNVQCAAAEAISKIGKNGCITLQIIDAVQRAIASPCEEVAIAAAEVHAHLGFKNSDFPITRLRTLLGSREPRVRLNAMSALGKFGPEAHAALSDILQGIKDGDRDGAFRYAAVETAGKLGERGAPLVLSLIGNLEQRFQQKPLARQNANILPVELSALISIGEKAVPEMVECLKRCEKKEYQDQLIAALEKIGIAAAELAVPTILDVIVDRAIKDRGYYLRCDLFRDLVPGELKAEEKALFAMDSVATNALYTHLEDPKSPIRGIAAILLGKMGVGQDRLFSVYQEILSEKPSKRSRRMELSSAIVRGAFCSLENEKWVPYAAKPVIARAISLLNSPHHDIRLNAKKFLGLSGSWGCEAICQAMQKIMQKRNKLFFGGRPALSLFGKTFQPFHRFEGSWSPGSDFLHTFKIANSKLWCVLSDGARILSKAGPEILEIDGIEGILRELKSSTRNVYILGDLDKALSNIKHYRD